MEGSRVVATLRSNRPDIVGRMSATAAYIAAVKHDLAHVDETMLLLFTEPGRNGARYMASHGLFRTGDIADLCVCHVSAYGEMTMWELAGKLMAKGWLHSYALWALR